MTSSLDKLNALSALAGLSRKAVAEREAAPKTPVNNAQNPTTVANLALAALAALVGNVAAGQINTAPVQDNVDLFDIEYLESLEIVVVINGKSNVVFSI